MKSDAELFGLGKGRKLKFGESGTEADDYEDVMASPDVTQQAEKQPLDYNGNDTRQSQTQPIGTPQTLPGVSDIAPVTTPTAPKTAMNTDGYAAPLVTTARTGTPAGYDAGKWGDADHQTPKYAVSGIVADAISKGAQEVTPDLVKQIAAAYPGTTQIDNESVNIPGLGPIRIINDGQLRWDQVDGQGQGVGASSPASAQSLEDIIAGSPSQTGLATQGASLDGGVNDELAQILAGGVDADPALAAYRRSAARDFGKLRANAAEQAAQDGTVSSGGMDGRVRQLQEGEAEAVAGFAGDRAAQVQSLKVQADQSLRQLGFNYDSLNQQQKQWMGNLAQNRDQFLQSLGLSYAQLSAQQRTALQQLEQQSDQFNKTLGFNYDTFEANQNNIAADRALGR